MADIINTDNGSVAAGKVNDKLATAITESDHANVWASKVNAATEDGLITEQDTASSFAAKVNAFDPTPPTPSVYDLRVCQYNIGHFNMGTSSGASCNIKESNTDGYPTSTSRKYSTQLQRWKSRISGIGADIIGAPEWNNNFGYNGNNELVSTVASGIFADYIPSEYTTAEQIAKRISVGKNAEASWWINTLVSKYDMSDAADTNSLVSSSSAYVRHATITVKGKQVKIGVTHLNWNNPRGATTDPDYTTNATNSYNLRQAEIKALVRLLNNWLDNYDHVILFGDFNTEGPVYGPNVSYDPSVRDYAAGLAEFDPFIDGCTVDGVAYGGGFTLANSNSRPLLTSPATNSRPDLSGRPQVPYCYLDNIIVKGFTMSNVQVIDDGTLTDHCAVVADLTLIDNE